MFALLLAATMSLPPGVVGEWQGVEPEQRAVVYNSGIRVTTGLNPDHSDSTFGFIAPFVETIDTRQFRADCSAHCRIDVIFHSDGSLEVRHEFLDIDDTTTVDTYRFTRPGLDGS